MLVENEGPKTLWGKAAFPSSQTCLVSLESASLVVIQEKLWCLHLLNHDPSSAFRVNFLMSCMLAMMRRLVLMSEMLWPDNMNCYELIVLGKKFMWRMMLYSNMLLYMLLCVVCSLAKLAVCYASWSSREAVKVTGMPGKDGPKRRAFYNNTHFYNRLIVFNILSIILSSNFFFLLLFCNSKFTAKSIKF